MDTVIPVGFASNHAEGFIMNPFSYNSTKKYTVVRTPILFDQWCNDKYKNIVANNYPKNCVRMMNCSVDQNNPDTTNLFIDRVKIYFKEILRNFFPNYILIYFDSCCF